MTGRRKERVAPPPGADEWDVRYANNEAPKGWDALSTHAPRATLEAWVLMRSDPRPPIDGRHKRLLGDLAHKDVDGRRCEQWQIEVTSGGRIWYAIDDAKHVVWVTYASPRHPKATE